ncbi:MAG: hypothetical protein COA49_05490 [Bacteroidetes bacterium]|nr:MAG: hypothetical protein COA49_05490 [Bacteroidota bacterium]
MKNFTTIICACLTFFILPINLHGQTLLYDGNSDGCVGLSDLLGLLSEFGTCTFVCGDQVSHDGYDYTTVQIGDQCWFSENCRYLPSVSPSSASSNTTPYYYVRDYNGTDVATALATSNYSTYGVLYNWPAIMEPGICPSGWHIPTDLEWQTLEIALGMSPTEAVSSSTGGYRGTDQGDQMRATSGWTYNGFNTNSSGFTGLPGGYVFPGSFYFGLAYGYWWSSTSSGTTSSWHRKLYFGSHGVNRFTSDSSFGYSARCVMD